MWISILPAWLVNLLGPASLLLVGWLVEKNFVGRITIFTNAIAINLFAYSVASPGVFLTWYANIGLIFGVIALLAYSSRSSLHSLFYDLGWVYSSIAVAVVILFFTIF